MSLTHDPRLRQTAKRLCRELRKNQTHAEKIFWEEVENALDYVLERLKNRLS